MQDELVRVRTALEKGDNPLSYEEIHLVKTCCQILRINSDGRAAALVMAAALDGGRGTPSGPS
jgi:hypothetical protein